MGAKVTVRDETKRVRKKAQQGNFNSLGHAGAALRLTARRSIRRRKKASEEGTPPSTRRGQLKGALQYAVEKEEQTVVIGPSAEEVGTSGAAHEHGGRYKGQRYPKRPFMGPALENIRDRLPELWANSVG